ncbi:MAG: hypothetical protein ABWZ99_17245 [Ilumatobacteraceae bacterium]
MRSWKIPVAAIIGGTLVVEGLMALTDMGPHVVLVAAVCVLVGVGVWFVADVIDVAVASTDMPVGLAPTPVVRTDRRVMRLRSGLAYGQRNDGSLGQLRASLVELVDDQLLAVHQIDRTADPDAARAALGDDLYAFVTNPDTARDLARPRSHDRILTLIERI